MAGLTCIFCSAENEPGEQLCRACFRRLPAEPVAAPPHVATEPGVPSEPSEPPETPANCPHCGEEVPDPGNRVCVECHRPLTRAEPVRLKFPGGDVLVDRRQPVKLGRDPATSPVAGLFTDRGNISRLHATVGVDEDGAWVRDERSLNGTYVNDIPVPPGTRFGLSDGDTLRLAADVAATVRVTDCSA
ncbi:MAG: FHA domain-containing protein [Pseudonocardiaceae bacterium]